MIPELITESRMFQTVTFLIFSVIIAQAEDIPSVVARAPQELLCEDVHSHRLVHMWKYENRLGNHVNQMAHSLVTAYAYNACMALYIPPVWYRKSYLGDIMFKNYTVMLDPRKALKLSETNFYNKRCFEHAREEAPDWELNETCFADARCICRGTPMSDFQLILQTFLHPFLNEEVRTAMSKEATLLDSDDTLTVHLRGDDLMSKSADPERMRTEMAMNFAWLQPPCSWYVRVAEEFGFKNIRVVTAPPKNGVMHPCVAHLVSFAKKTKRKIFMQDNSNAADFGTLLASRNIALSLSTFAETGAIASKTVKRIFKFHKPRLSYTLIYEACKPLTGTEVIMYGNEKFGNWSNRQCGYGKAIVPDKYENTSWASLFVYMKEWPKADYERIYC
eukprot:m.44144 g.44144  ORF g.44144 m.44144 type:complete len:390 (-) comp10050_c0_seq2:170-1339(-)